MLFNQPMSGSTSLLSNQLVMRSNTRHRAPKSIFRGSEGLQGRNAHPENFLSRWALRFPTKVVPGRLHARSGPVRSAPFLEKVPQGKLLFLERVVVSSASPLEKVPQCRVPAPVRLPVSANDAIGKQSVMFTHLAHSSTGHADPSTREWFNRQGKIGEAMTLRFVFPSNIYFHDCVFDRYVIRCLLSFVYM